MLEFKSGARDEQPQNTDVATSEEPCGSTLIAGAVGAFAGEQRVE